MRPLMAQQTPPFPAFPHTSNRLARSLHNLSFSFSFLLTIWSTTMSSISRLPDSVLQQILSELLALPYESFAKFSDHNTYWTTRTSTAYTILLVCKRWAAVGQPSLYNGVILRRKKQAETLARTLRDTAIAKGCTGKGTRLARRIRWLRIDNVQCMAVEKIIRAATNVEELHLSHTMPTFRSKGIDWLAAFRCISPDGCTSPACMAIQ
ncbi:hypothetical protein BD413DRAFT_277737 [Trametes elegans]|nr:hypothetical protein BD413DRAFT_277737 [Trametes elegans]